MPNRPVELADDQMLGDWSGGTLFIGSKGKLVCGTYAKEPKLLGIEQYEPLIVMRRVGEGEKGTYEKDWARDCKENKQNRVMLVSSFDYDEPFTETVLMGNVAVHLQVLKRKLQWNGENMKFRNIHDGEVINVL